MNRNLRGTLVVCAALVFSICLGPSNSRAQSLEPSPSPPQERPQLKNFGSSLKRLHWDRKQNAAVEKKPEVKPGAQEEDEVVRVETNLVVCNVQVRDRRGNTITNLASDDFVITEDNQPQRIQHFSLGSDLNVGRTIVLLIDYSGSQAPYIRTSVAAAKTLVDQLGPKDLMAVVTDDVSLLVDFTRDKEKLKKALDKLVDRSKAGNFGRSQQFKALMATVREMFNNEDIRPIVIFQTDGDELFGMRPSRPPLFSIPDHGPVDRNEHLSFSLRDLYRTIEKSRVSVYTVIPGFRYIEGLNQTELKREKVDPRRFTTDDVIRWQQLAAAGAAIGGWTAYLQRPEEANEIYGRILADINSRYIIGYYPTNKVRDGKRRRVVVDVRNHPDYEISGRKAYIAPEPDN